MTCITCLYFCLTPIDRFRNLKKKSAEQLSTSVVLSNLAVVSPDPRLPPALSSKKRRDSVIGTSYLVPANKKVISLLAPLRQDSWVRSRNSEAIYSHKKYNVSPSDCMSFVYSFLVLTVHNIPRYYDSLSTRQNGSKDRELQTIDTQES